MERRFSRDPHELHTTCAWYRRRILEQSHASNTGHIGSALSVVDIMAVLWNAVMRDPGTSRPDRDRFVLAKGHAALALYVALLSRNLLSEEQFATYCRDGSQLGVHPEHDLRGVDLSTGSLGQGLSVAAGCAFGLRLQHPDARVFALLSDAECNEGQVWEAVLFAAHHKLANLTAVVDVNGLQALGDTSEILDMNPLADKWRAFGWEVAEVQGHDPNELYLALQTGAVQQPKVVLARTELGHGVSFMRNQVEWHYRNLTAELAEIALSEQGDA